MPVKLRPSGLGSGIDEDRPDYTAYSGGWDVGRMYETRGGPDSLRASSVPDHQRPDDTIEPRGDLGTGQGAVSEELRRMEGLGEAGGN